LETFSRIELPCPTALSVRSTKAIAATAVNMTAHHVRGFRKNVSRATRTEGRLAACAAERASEVRSLAALEQHNN